MIRGSTRVFAVLGDPVAHSLSPAMHNAAFRALGLNAVYVPLKCDPTDVGALMRALARAGGGGNVTIPHKSRAAQALETASPVVTELDACNTFWASVDGGVPTVTGDNTDVEGVLAAVDALEVPPGPWLILGTGGSARAVVAAARERGAPIDIRSRSSSRAADFAAWSERLGATVILDAPSVLVVNTTPLGLGADDPLPLPPGEAGPAVAVLDLVYVPGETRWVRSLRKSGRRAVDGRVTLVAQGAAAFSRWFPDIDAPVEVMRAVVDAALR